ncbi:NAD-dependent epimerase/dehydratase family protein [Parafilimonas terrae]|jgi:nucleoside-diphosphate-sugar epimerase|uniref:Nucleoside-diphosphate-sugar epimerase n=1 Tax=Parafilimonas terrae TaxID=1465490 RepID=A0A1I5X1Y2_9BACT|nr:NAD-dependent epimerase/dehydratase family protein [Parafilimonas terrae]SFQ25891.1 Nucleoside-diphosphate-sugar epimerase [Parafilimonas terrae]
MLHTILGANGSIASELLPILLQYNERVRLVSRSPKPVDGVETIAADATNYEQVLKAVEGSGIVYLLIGLEYKIEVWRKQWPKIMQHVINACKATNAKLIFFDNVYMYGKVSGPMTEETPFKPVSKKGQVRAAIATTLLNEMKTGSIKALIARAADFYGPGAGAKSVIGILAFDKLLHNKTPQVMASAKPLHSYTYTKDAAEALYILSQHEEAFGQTWHLPTARPALSSIDFISMIADETGMPHKIQTIPKFVIAIAALFNSLMRELKEMLYQNEYDYIFDSSKFEKAFNYKPTPYKKGIQGTIEWMKSQ